MKRILTLPLLKGIIALVLMFTGTLSVSAQVYYMNVFQKDGSKVKYLVEDVDSIFFSFENAPIEGVEYVDLGLSVMWATFNVGASSPSEFGDYFAWGEIEPKQDYSMAQYRYWTGYDSLGNEQFSKYVVASSLGSFGTIDGKTVLDEEDDAAYAKWGGAWRIPTRAEFEELTTKCTWQWVDSDGETGFLITSNVDGYSDRSIFMPAAGKFGTELVDASLYGRYWSSSLFTSHSAGAYALNIGGGSYSLGGYYRNWGCSVRPVCTSNTWRGITSVTLDNSNVELTVGGSSVLKATLLSGNEDYSFMSAVTWSSDNPGVAAVDSKGIVTAVSAGTAVIKASCKGVSATCTVIVKDYVPVADFVDLGLSVQWATCNIGAMKPEEAGHFYAWGEIETKSTFTWDNYKFGNKNNGYTKYNFFEEYGPVDYKYRLDMQDDVARVILGSEWRMPTIEELEELIYQCEWEWTSMNGVDGYNVTGPNGNSIFLPAGGYRYDDGSPDEGWTSYLSSTLSGDTDGCAMGIDFSSYSHYTYVEGRILGELIRPVHSSSVPENVLNVQGIEFTADTVFAYVETTGWLSANILGDSSSFNIRPKFTCADDEGYDVLGLASDGYYEAVAAGECDVIATLGSFSAKCHVVVIEKTVALLAGEAFDMMKAYMSSVNGNRHNDFGYPSIMMMTDANGIDVVQEENGYNWNGGDLDFSDRNNTYVAPLIVWNTLYNIISASNEVIGKTGYNTDDPYQLFALGQMLALRAFCYWNLAQLYQFNYVGNQNKPCVPIITELNAQEAAVNGCARATVAQVYSQIMNDLNNAIGSLTSARNLGLTRSDKRFMDVSVVYGLRARVNLTMGEWRQAAADAQSAINVSTARPSSMAEASRPAFWTANEPDWMWGIIVNEEDDVVQSGIVNYPSHMGSFNYGYCLYSGGRQINMSLYNSMNSTDVRKGWWIDNQYYSPNLTQDELDYIWRYGYRPYTQVKFAPYNNVVGTDINANDIPLMRIEEMYLILAEGKAMSGANNEARSILESFIRTYRDSEYVCPDVTGAALQDEIWRQRRIELWGEGLAWFDIMRLGKDVDRRGAGYPDSYCVFNIPAGSDILLWRIPASVINSNPLISEQDNNPAADAPEPVEDYELYSKEMMVGYYNFIYESYWGGKDTLLCQIIPGDSTSLIIKDLLFSGSEIIGQFDGMTGKLVIEDMQFMGATSAYDIYLSTYDLSEITFHCSTNGTAIAYGSDSEENILMCFVAMQDDKVVGYYEVTVGDVLLVPYGLWSPGRVAVRERGEHQTGVQVSSRKGESLKMVTQD